MAGAAAHSCHTVSVGTAANIHVVAVTVISLPGEITFGMAIHASRMM